MSELAERAMGLAVDGYRVHPLQPRSKLPRWRAWQEKATSEPDVVASWWDEHPEDNIGIATGDGLVVIDVDAGGVATMNELQDRHGKLPRTRTVRTASGFHAYFRCPILVTNSARALGAGVDVRGDGGFVVAPPSIHPEGGTYSYVGAYATSDLPDVWIALLRSRPRLTLSPETTYGEGSRNDALMRRAGQMRRNGLEGNVIEAALLELNRTQCVPPLRDAEVRQIAASVARYAPEESGELLRSQRARHVLSFKKAIDVPPEPVDWIWYGYLPRGKLVLQDGDPGLGKSTIWIDLAARVTRGDDMPLGVENGLGRPADVILMMNEDGMGDTIVPRLIAANADLERVHILDGSFSVPEDVPALEAMIRATGAKLVVLDPIGAHLGTERTDLHNDASTRRALAPLTAMAEATNVVIGANRHLTKSRDGQAMMRGMGSVGLIAVARVGWAVAPDPDDENGRLNVLAQTKTNLSRRLPSMTYQIDEVELPNGIQTSRVQWIGLTNKSANDLIGGEEFQPTDEQRCAQWVKRTLADGEPHPIETLASAFGFDKGTVKRTRFELEDVIVVDDTGWRLA